MQNAERRMQNAECTGAVRGEPLQARFVDYAVRIIYLSASLPKTEEGLMVRRQVLRSGTSAGANYHEACGGESRSDFVHKLQIALKELRETQYWLAVITGAELLPQPRLVDIRDETEQLLRILVKSLKTARRSDSHAR